MSEENKNKKAGNPQGINIKGNALAAIARQALVLALIPGLLGLAYLVMIRESGVQARQVEQVAGSYARQQAAHVSQLFTILENRLRGAAQSPLALSAIASQSGTDVELVEQAMLDYFPEVISLRLIPLADRGTAELEGGTGGLRNHIEVDLVRRTAEGKQTEPESYQFEGKWLTSTAYLVSHPRIDERTAVIIVTLDNSLVADELDAYGSSAGRSALQQVFMQGSITRVDDIAVAGSGDATDYSRVETVTGTPWQLTFTPSAGLVEDLGINPLPLLGVVALVILGAVGSIIFMLMRFRSTLDRELQRVILGADKRSGLDVNIPELEQVATQLRKVTRRHKPGGEPEQEDAEEEPAAAHAPQSDLINPMFQTGSILDEEEDEGDEELLELDIEVETSEPEAAETKAEPAGFPDHIFRAYDIRGVASTELDDQMVSQIGAAIGTIAGEMDQQAIIVGADGRLSSPRIKNALVKALLATGRDVIDIGVVPTPMLYYATHQLACHSGIMITGSHNPGDHNGFKIVLNQHTIAAGGIQQIRQRILEKTFSTGSGRLIQEDIVQPYRDEIISDIAIAEPLKIVVDAGSGITGAFAPGLLEDLGCEVIPLHCEVDGHFPHHPPDTSDESNLSDLIASVKGSKADFGVAFDGDGDRLAVVTGSGKIVRADRLLMLFAEDVVSRNPGADVVFDVKCSRHLPQLISSKGGRPVLWKTGHAFMKEKMRETGALLGGEFSGHMFFGERWFGFDDGLYAAARLAEILSTTGESLEDTLARYPRSVSTSEILIPVDEGKKFDLMDRIQSTADFSPGKVSDVDGVRVDYNEGWGLLRASNTSPNLTARFEADSEEALESIKQVFRAQVALVEPTFELDI